MKTLNAILLIVLSIFSCSFVQSSNNPIFEGIPDISIYENSGKLQKIINLNQYATGEEINPLNYEITRQTNNNLIDCFIEENIFVTCNAPQKDSIGMSSITIKATDSNGASKEDTFNIVISKRLEPKETIVVLERKKVSLAPGTSIAIMFEATNNTGEKECYEINSKLPNEDLTEVEIKPAKNQFCIEDKQTIQFSIFISAFESARTKTYYPTFNIISSKGPTITQNLEVDVSNTSNFLSIERASGYFVCKNPYKQKIQLDFQNNIGNDAGSSQEFNLSASNPVLLPEFEYPKISLRPSEQVGIGLMINTNPGTAFGEYAIKITAENKDYKIKREIKINLIECEEDIIDVYINPEIMDLKKGQQKTAIITIFNKSKEEQEVFVNSEGDLENKVESVFIKLKPQEQKKINLDIKAREQDEKGEYDLIVYVWNSKESEKKKIQVNVRAEHNIELEISGNDYQRNMIVQGENKVFELTIYNYGDYEETIKASVKEFGGIKAKLSEENFKIKKNSSKKIYVAITPGYEVVPGNYEVPITARSDSDGASQNLKITIVKAMQKIDLDIVSYPLQIEAVQGQEKEISLVIKNNLPSEVKNVIISIAENGKYFIMQPVAIERLNGFESVEIKAGIQPIESLEDGVYPVKIEIISNNFKKSQEMVIKVEREKISQKLATPATGLFSLTSGGIILSAIIVLIIAILAGIGANKLMQGKPNTT
jgi:uncharacterized membrane protein